MGHQKRSEIVSYKGRPYRCTWRGQAKFQREDGTTPERARLEFMDGSKSFYVDAEKLEPYVQSEAARERAVKKQCWECGCMVTYAEVASNGGDWNESVGGAGECYCGC